MPPRSPMGGVKTHVEDNHTHDVRYVLRNLWKYLYRYRFGMFAVLALSLLSNVLALLGPRLSGAAIDAITGGEHVNFPSVYRYALLMLAFYAVSAGLSFLISVYMVRLSQKIVSAMRCDAFQSISRLPVGFTDRHAIGDILSVISYDIDTLSTSLAHDVVQILSSVVTVVGSLYMMLTISPLLILVFAVTIPLSVFITRFITSRTRPLFRARSRKLGELNGFVEEMLSGLKTAMAGELLQFTSSTSGKSVFGLAQNLDEAEVGAMANDSTYGLGGAVFTRDLDRAFRVARGIETGRVWVNTYNAIPEGAPFGGYKTSGIGRETHKVILEHYTQMKNIMIDLSGKPSGFYPKA